MRLKRLYISMLIALAFTVSLSAPALAYTSVPYDQFIQLDSGIYWFGKGNVCQKFVSGQDNPYYSPARPTVIYVHGWQPGEVQKLRREDFDYEQYSLYNSADKWVDIGWNVGIFYWNQYADEGSVNDAEAKIWTAAGPRGMRWRKSDGTYVSTQTNKAASDLFVDQFVSAMSNYTGNDVRIAGHSLGNQMATVLTKKLSDLVDSGQLAPNRLPKRVALLDPYWSNYSKDYLGGRWTGEVCRDYVTALKTKGVVFEYYKSSAINDLWLGDANLVMQQITTLAELAPWYVPQIDQVGKHNVAPRIYFLTLGYNAPECTIDFWGNRKLTGDYSPNANMSNAEIGSRMDSGERWVQVEGRYTQAVTDDWFELKLK